MACRVARLVSVWLATLFALFAASCGDGGRCESDPVPPACNQPCGAETSCPVGFYCGDEGTCTADCVYGGREMGCADDRICSEEGHCVPR